MSVPKVTGSLRAGRAAPPGQMGSGVVAVIGPYTNTGAANTPVAIASAPLSTIQSLVGVHALGKCVANMALQTGWRKIIAVPATATAGYNSAVTESGTSPPDVTLTGDPLAGYRIRVEILTAGARGTATFRYSLDNGTTWSGAILTAATYLMTEASATTGVTLNFATGTSYATDNVYTATCYGPTVSTTNLATAMDALKATAHEFDCVVVLTAFDGSGATDSERATAWSNYYAQAVTEVAELQSIGKPAVMVIPGSTPVTTATSADIVTWSSALAAAGLAVTRNRQVVSVAGPIVKSDAIGDQLRSRYGSPIFEAAALLGSYPLDRDLGLTGDNGEYALNCVPEYDEYIFGALHDAGFVTTVFANNQWYFSAGITHSAEYGFNRICNVRIANYIYRLALWKLNTWKNRDVDRNSAADVTETPTLIELAPTPIAASEINDDISKYVNLGVQGLLNELAEFTVDETYASTGLRGDISFKANVYTDSITFTVTAE